MELRKRPIAFLLLIVLLIPSTLFSVEREQRPVMRKIIVKSERDYPPYAYTEQGRAVGFSVDLLMEVARIMNVNAEITPGPWHQIRDELERGRIDIISGMISSPQRAKKVDFSSSYLVLTFDIFIRKGSLIYTLDDIWGKEIIVEQGGIMHDFVVEKAITKKILTAKGNAEVMKLLASGTADCALMNRMTALYYIDTLRLDNVKPAGANFLRRQYCFAFAKGREHLLNDFNEGLALLNTTGKYRGIYNRWFGVYEEKTFWEKAKYPAIVAGLIAILLFLSIIWSWSLRKQVKLKTAELRNSEEQHRYFFEHAMVGIFRSLPEGRFISVNPAMADIYGSESPEEMIASVTDIAKLYVNPTDRLLLMEVLERQNVVKQYEVERYRKDGGRIWVSMNMWAVRDSRGNLHHYEGLIEDVTRRRKAEDALRESEQKYRNIFENAVVGIYQSTPEGRFTGMNHTFARMFGYESPPEMMNAITDIGSQLYVNPALRTELLHRFEQQGTVRNFEQEMYRKDGTPIWLSLSARIIRDDSGKALYCEGMVEDITDRKRIEEELDRHRAHLEELVEERTLEIAQANERLKEMDHLKSMFIASMSHELRTPLNSIIGFTGMTLQGLSGELNAEQKDNLDRTYRSAVHLLELITDIIDISKIEAGKIDVFPENFLLADMIDEAVNIVQTHAGSKGLALEIEIPSGLKMHTDRKRLLQCVINFLGNAVKYTERGTVRLIATERDGMVEISVSDTGIGIAEHDIPRLFQSFERLESGLKVKAGGTGLGLYLTKKIIVELLQGTVSVQSRQGHGSTFSMKVPNDLEGIIHTGGPQ